MHTNDEERLRELGEGRFQDIIGQLPKADHIKIETRLHDVSADHLKEFEIFITQPEKMLHAGSFIENEIFPFVALQAVRNGVLNPFQFGTLMMLWGDLDILLPQPSASKPPPTITFVPLCNIDGTPNEEAFTQLIPYVLDPIKSPYFFSDETEAILNEIKKNLHFLSQIGRGFWLINYPRENKRHSPSTPTITERIQSLNFGFFATNPKDAQAEIIPSFELYQLFIAIALPEPMHMHPVIGSSSLHDIRQGNIEGYRDIGLPFPGYPLPKEADNLPAPRASDFIRHDWYHTLRASRILAEEKMYYVIMGNELEKAQLYGKNALKTLENRYLARTHLLPKVKQVIEKLPAEKQDVIIKKLSAAFKKEQIFMQLLKKRCTLLGTLKAKLWDMEPPYSGSTLDNPAAENSFQKLTRVIANTELYIHMSAQQLGYIDTKFTRYLGHGIGTLLLRQVNPDSKALTTYQKTLLNLKPVWNDNKNQFLLAILNASPTEDEPPSNNNPSPQH